ncbi:MAG: late competence development ComFB family protein [Bacillota bacterium]|nr:late competence development ComFB family protein [Bacillota bacterium]
MVRNYMEDILDLILPNVLNDCNGICKCSQCVEDIKAIALNNLQPHYVVTEKGMVYTKVNELVVQFRADVIKEAVRAIDIVSMNPRHVIE